MPIDADYSVLNVEIEKNAKAPKFKTSEGARITKFKNILGKSHIDIYRFCV